MRPAAPDRAVTAGMRRGPLAAATAGERRQLHLLALLAATLAALAAWQVVADAEDETLTGIAMPVRPPPAAAAAPARAGGGTDTASILERPVFSPSRSRMAPIAPAQAAPPPPPPPEAPPLSATWQLLGLSQSEGQAVALLRPASGGAVTRLRQGEAIEGEWVLAGIEQRRSAVFARGEERQSLALPSAAPPSAAGPGGGMGGGGGNEEDE
jgi:hypothetical protein